MKFIVDAITISTFYFCIVVVKTINCLHQGRIELDFHFKLLCSSIGRVSSCWIMSLTAHSPELNFYFEIVTYLAYFSCSSEIPASIASVIID